MAFYNFMTVLLLIIAVLIVLVVLVQNSKGGGLASNFAGSNQYMGVRKTADFLEKATWTLAIAMLLIVLGTSKIIPKYTRTTIETQSEINVNALPVPTTPFNPAATEQAPPEQGGQQESE
ncbi:MAG: preprotein translocase subunit SecG [Bacteroidales bacterium]|jgi:preprotein translocase subunit SecG|nr:preprotein translocase subunit SecG [Bacteroidales bacterium]NCU35298.1 preprotein translocase subunit SecG [Candidatus Falkowbacteria bacterium]MDD2631376.1 preprotein translocase subunit SecG [Bacteroidales bacterium]MDD3130797.1 preprotein translocase subunit SecG [Bacteroidales bacterium]MDD3526284.1 preprotein translocase subunit SecG [Bacteroidales bacterium]